MIPRTISTVEALDWKAELSRAVTTLAELARLVDIDPAQMSTDAHEEFRLLVPHPYIARIRRGDPEDPLLRQILPAASEILPQPGYSQDPLKEEDYSVTPGLIHKYKSRALLIAGTHCAINCRYCFRRHFPYQAHRNSRNDWSQALDYLRSHPELNEVILSGGDPLAINDRQLQWLSQEIETISHIRRLRIHTRLPVVIPARIDASLTDWISHLKLQTVVVLHINHPNEIDLPLQKALARLKDTGATLLNQTVLLKGINNCAHTLTQLSEQLFAAGVLPYYLHQLDTIKGAAHFHVDPEQARHIYRQLLANLPGFLVPRWVAEIPGRASKTPLDLHLC